jgi:GIY-YIG catalytic domain
MSEGAYLYILRCADDSYYTGTARSGLEQRVAEHNVGTYGGYTAQRRPVNAGILSMVRPDYRRHRRRAASEGLVDSFDGDLSLPDLMLRSPRSGRLEA